MSEMKQSYSLVTLLSELGVNYKVSTNSRLATDVPIIHLRCEQSRFILLIFLLHWNLSSLPPHHSTRHLPDHFPPFFLLAQWRSYEREWSK